MSNQPAPKGQPSDTRDILSLVFRDNWDKLVSFAARITRDLELAEDAVQEAFGEAAMLWERSGVPRNPAAWIARVAQRRAIDRIRHSTSFDRRRDELLELADTAVEPTADFVFPDDRLRLIFTCCHPALPEEAQVALTLRVVCGFSVDAIARGFGIRPDAVSKRLVRARARIRERQVPYEVPERSELPARLTSVLRVLYLVFTAGYDVPAPADATEDLAREAIRLTRVLRELLQDDAPAELLGLLALMLLHDARRASRFDADGRFVLLESQDRRTWDRARIAEGTALVEQALVREPGVYALQAAIAAVHCEAQSHALTDWPQIVALYNAAIAIEASPVLRLNRAVALSMVEGPAVGLAAVDRLAESLDGYRVFHSTRAALLDRLEQPAAARAAFERALELTDLEGERQFLNVRLARLE
jgi:RNA polymerase sigma-70 factor, ECF subfamily